MSEVGSATPSRRKRRILGLDDQQRQAQRRTLLLDAALELFGTRGYAKTSIELLCQTAGIGTNSFYDLFANKEAVLVGLYDRISDRLRQGVTEAYTTHEAAHRDGSALIRALVSRFVHEMTDDPTVARVAFIESAGVSVEVEEHRRRTRNDFVDGLQAIGRAIRDASTDPVIVDEQQRPGPSPRRNAVALVGAITEMTLDWLLDPDPDPIENLVNDITHHCQRVMNAIIQESLPNP